MKNRNCIIFLLLFISQTVFGQAWVSGKSYFDNEKWTEFIPGDMPLVISVPHGGDILLPEVPLRACEGAVTVTDSRTIELAREIQDAFQRKYKMRPYIVICHLSRKAVDQNREIASGTCGNEMMKKPWQQFHDYIDTALSLAVRKFGLSVYIDLHGHGHPIQRLELGYGINGNELPRLSGGGDTKDLAEKSSLNNLLSLNSSANFKDLMIGDYSFGTLITDKGSPAIPGKQMKKLNEGEKYFNGGYNTRRYTSKDYPRVFGWQIESNYKGVRDPSGRPAFAAAFAEAFMIFLRKNTSVAL